MVYHNISSNLIGSYCDCKNRDYVSTFVEKAAHAVAHPFFDMKAILNLEELKFPWNCTLTSADVSESSDGIPLKLSDGSKVSDKYHEFLGTAVASMSGMKIMKGLDNKGPKMNLLVHPMTITVNLFGQSSERDMMDMSK